jgi:hypothetical protein
MKQHGSPRYTNAQVRSMTANDTLRHGDILIDRDGDTSMLWHGLWVPDPQSFGDGGPNCKFVAYLNEYTNKGEETVPRAVAYEPYGWWWQHSYITEVPKFRTPEEAEAWLSANAR